MQDQINAQQDLFPRFPRVTEQPIPWGPQNKLRAANEYKAIVDSNTGKVFSIVSKDYKIISHEQAIEQIESVIAKNDNLGRYDTKIDLYNGGGRMRCTFTFPEISAEIERGDYINPQLHLSNSYDVTWPFVVTLGALRVLCSNGLVIGVEIFNIKKRHVYELDELHIRESIANATKRFKKQTEKWRNLTDIPLHPKTYERVMRSMKFGKNAAEEIQHRIDHDADGHNNKNFAVISLWTFYNVLTWYITHKAVSLNHRVEMENRLRIAMVCFRRAQNGSRKGH
ncbi:MAG: DUF932 domain-containing protein [Syntrophales bacterium]|nr:DUF932 domain-containing protein [Syntrophales bacterium]